MGIGGSIFLIALGAILAFAVEADLGVLDLNVVGWVLMLAGLAGLVITLWFWKSRRRTVVSRPADAAYAAAGSGRRRVPRGPPDEQPPLRRRTAAHCPGALRPGRPSRGEPAGQAYSAK